MSQSLRPLALPVQQSRLPNTAPAEKQAEGASLKPLDAGATASNSRATAVRCGEQESVPNPLEQSQCVTAAQIRRIILEQSFRARVGHIGSALSVADILAALYASVLRIPSIGAPDRDRFILSKGHAALALYAALHLRGWISQDELNTYCADNSLLGVHPEFQQPGIDFATGSLGQGLSMGVGAALAARWQSSQRRVYVLLSDAECNEGAVWEAVMLANHHRLSNLVAIVDLNGQQALGTTDKVVNMNPMDDKWRAFGWDTHVVDGHDSDALTHALLQLDTFQGPPHVLLAKTVCGKGVSFMEGEVRWHYLPMNPQQYQQALMELQRKP